MPADALDRLERRASDLGARADRLTDRYNRTTWFRFALVFFPVPFVVVLLRLHLDYWHYYLAGGAYIVFSLALFAYDTRLSDRRDAAHKEAEEARQDMERARLRPEMPAR